MGLRESLRPIGSASFLFVFHSTSNGLSPLPKYEAVQRKHCFIDSPPCTCRTLRPSLIIESFLFVEPQNSPCLLLKFTLEPSLDSLLSYLCSFLGPLFWLVELRFLSLIWDDRKEMCALSGSANFFCLRKCLGKEVISCFMTELVRQADEFWQIWDVLGERWF